MNSCRSQSSELKSGVPQGSVLDSLLFLILLGGIDYGIIKTFLSSFADDTRIGSQIMSAEDGKNLQTDLHTLYSWTTQNNMKLNGDKFECLRYGPNHTLQDTIQYRSNTGSIIQAKSSVRDLGITMSNTGSFKEHIQFAVFEAKQQCSWILRTFNTREATATLSLSKALIQHKLDYCSQLWCPLQTVDIKEIKMVQRTFLQKILGLKQLRPA